MPRNVRVCSQLRHFIGLAAIAMLLGCSTASVQWASKQVSRNATAAAGKEDEERAPTITSKIAAWKDDVTLKVFLARSKSGYQVFKKLIPGGGEKETRFATMLNNPKLHLVEQYVDIFNKKHPNQEISVFKILKEAFGENVIAKGLVTAKQRKPSDLVTKLQNQQFESWMADGHPNKKAILELKISEKSIVQPDGRSIPALKDFLEYKAKVTSLPKQSLSEALWEGFGEAEFALILHQLKFSGLSTKELQHHAAQLFKHWQGTGYTSEDLSRTVFKNIAHSDGRRSLIIKQYEIFLAKRAKAESVTTSS